MCPTSVAERFGVIVPEGPPIALRTADGEFGEATAVRLWVRLSDDEGAAVDLRDVPVYCSELVNQVLVGTRLVSHYFNVTGPRENDWTLEADPRATFLPIPILPPR